MATSISAALTGSNGVWAQLQQQQAQRLADQADEKARVLQVRARDARVDADRASEKARVLGVESEQAKGDAQTARRGLASLDSLSQVRSGFDDLRQQLSEVLHPETQTTGTSAITATASGGLGTTDQQTLGSLIDVTA